MKADVRQVGPITVIDLAGKITIGEGEVVLRERIEELSKTRRRHLLLNLENVSYMDSCGVAELVACFKRTTVNGGTVKLLNPSARVRDLLRVTMLDELFEVFFDEAEAIRSFGQRRPFRFPFERPPHATFRLETQKGTP